MFLSKQQTKENAMNELTAKQVCRLMRQNRQTIRGIATRWNLTLNRVREVREKGVRGEAFVRDWLEILTTPASAV